MLGRIIVVQVLHFLLCSLFLGDWCWTAMWHLFERERDRFPMHWVTPQMARNIAAHPNPEGSRDPNTCSIAGCYAKCTLVRSWIGEQSRHRHSDSGFGPRKRCPPHCPDVRTEGHSCWSCFFKLTNFIWETFDFTKWVGLNLVWKRKLVHCL